MKTESPVKADTQTTKCIRIIRNAGRFIEAKRPDGLTIFFDTGDDEVSRLLNQVRIKCPAWTLIRLLGIVRGHQISISYARRWCPETVPSLEADFINFQAKLRAYLSGIKSGFPSTLPSALSNNAGLLTE